MSSNAKSQIDPMSATMQPARRRSFGLLNASEIVLDAFTVKMLGYSAIYQKDSTHIVNAKNIDPLTVSGQISMGKSISLVSVENITFAPVPGQPE